MKKEIEKKLHLNEANSENLCVFKGHNSMIDNKITVTFFNQSMFKVSICTVL